MRQLLRILIVILAVGVTAGASVAYAQDAAILDAPFAFRVGSVVHQPGKYELRPNGDQMGVTITPPKGAATMALVVTRLAEPEPPLPDGKVVFDKVGELYFLSEVWIPGMDGFLLHSAKEKHSHVKVKLTKKG
ncbi:MAG TPA: hypothetical protein VGK32_12025 [Vicinamibacterales bacterium]|jgi:hypothetical protein